MAATKTWIWARWNSPPGGLVRNGGGNRWTYYESPLPMEKVWLDPPFNVVALYFVGRSLYRMPPGSIYLDDITV